LSFAVGFPILERIVGGQWRNGAPMTENRMVEASASEAMRRLRSRLIAAGMRPTRQRMALGELLFRAGDRHVTAEKLYEEAVAAALPVSLATVYNTLHQFTDVGLLREIAVDGARVYFDTNVSEHHHFLVADGDALVDIPGADVNVVNLPPPPPGMKIARIDVVVRLAKED
jgi:Fur family iron response transcriptional regulator